PRAIFRTSNAKKFWRRMPSGCRLLIRPSHYLCIRGKIMAPINGSCPKLNRKVVFNGMTLKIQKFRRFQMSRRTRDRRGNIDKRASKSTVLEPEILRSDYFADLIRVPLRYVTSQATSSAPVMAAVVAGRGGDARLPTWLAQGRCHRGH